MPGPPPFEARDESKASYTIFSDSTTPIGRAQTDSTGPGQAHARAIFEVSERMKTRGCSVTIRCIPALNNGAADKDAKVAAASAGDTVDRLCLREASLAHLT